MAAVIALFGDDSSDSSEESDDVEYRTILQTYAAARRSAAITQPTGAACAALGVGMAASTRILRHKYVSKRLVAAAAHVLPIYLVDWHYTHEQLVLAHAIRRLM